MLKVKDIETYYGSIQALKGISLEVNEGEVVTLLGSNGAGKSTTLKTISRLLRPVRGTIEFMGERIDPLKPEVIVQKGIAHVPEGRKIFPGLTVRDNLMLGASGRVGLSKAQIAEEAERMLELFPALKPFADKLGWTLSGGQQQMLAIARGLMAHPKLLLLDEPSLGLAPVLVQEVFHIIRDINTRGTTILLVEQNAFMALKVAHRGYVMETGKIVLHDLATNLLNNEQVKRAYLGTTKAARRQVVG
ncbi:MAG TPA: ABC transporter ATP-binding protein [Candidatus Limnocylindrales bacterium]|nr:ABC transporter ATP-binding protein [Candidatus Limnocylindrales bacterium]